MNHSKFFGSKLSASLLAILALGVASTSAFAASTQTTTFSVTATVQATCAISATALGFGTYTGTAAAAQSTVSVTCTNTTPYNVGLDAGLSGGTVTTRKMKSGAATLAYSLTQNLAGTTNWGNTVGTDTESGTGNGSSQTLTVYGQLAGSQYVTPGSYSDTITATVTY